MEALLPGSAPDTGYLMAERARRMCAPVVLFDAVLDSNSASSCSADMDAERYLARTYELYALEGELMVAHRYSSGSFLWRMHKKREAGGWADCVRRLDSSLPSAHSIA